MAARCRSRKLSNSVSALMREIISERSTPRELLDVVDDLLRGRVADERRLALREADRPGKLALEALASDDLRNVLPVGPEHGPDVVRPARLEPPRQPALQ